jgi:hypothetical protein
MEPTANREQRKADGPLEQIAQWLASITDLRQSDASDDRASSSQPLSAKVERATPAMPITPRDSWISHQRLDDRKGIASHRIAQRANSTPTGPRRLRRSSARLHDKEGGLARRDRTQLVRLVLLRGLRLLEADAAAGRWAKIGRCCPGDECARRAVRHRPGQHPRPCVRRRLDNPRHTRRDPLPKERRRDLAVQGNDLIGVGVGRVGTSSLTISRTLFQEDLHRAVGHDAGPDRLKRVHADLR